MTQIYASIRESSKYYYQQPSEEKFPIEFVHDAYPVVGNSNRYCLSDVDLFAMTDKGFIRLTRET